jgi:hypothetical protein
MPLQFFDDVANETHGDKITGPGETAKSIRRGKSAHLDTILNNGRANLLVCPDLTASQRSHAGGIMGIRTPEHRSARSGRSLGGAAAPPYLGGVKSRPAK